MYQVGEPILRNVKYPRSCWSAITSVNGKIYAFGVKGQTQYDENSYDVLSAVVMYDGKVWKDMPPMSVDRKTCACAVVGSKIYVVGGNEILAFNQSSEVFDTITNTWSQLSTNMITPRWGCAATAIDNELYVFGGMCDKSAEMYNMNTGVWTKLPDMSVDRHYPISVHVGSKIYVLGGSRHLSMDIFHRNTRAWSRGPPMTYPLSAGCTAIVITNKIILFGCHGYDSEESKSKVETFDIEYEIWETMYICYPRTDPNGSKSNICAIGKDVFAVDESNGLRCLSEIELINLLRYDSENASVSDTLSDSSSSQSEKYLYSDYAVVEDSIEVHYFSFSQIIPALLSGFVAATAILIFISGIPSMRNSKESVTTIDDVIDRVIQDFMDPVCPF
jgi:hypothetical protein